MPTCIICDKESDDVLETTEDELSKSGVTDYEIKPQSGSDYSGTTVMVWAYSEKIYTDRIIHICKSCWFKYYPDVRYLR